MTFLDLFAGYGGFRLGMEQAGNAVTVNVVYEIGKRLKEIEECEKNAEKNNTEAV